MAKKQTEPSHADMMLARYQEIGHRAEDQANAYLTRGQDAEARRVLTEAQRDLRDLKREIGDAEREIRLAGTEARQKVTGQRQMTRAFGKTARSVGASMSAAQKNDIAIRQTAALAEYAPIKSAITELIADLDRMKAELSDPAPAVPPSPSGPPAPPTVPAQWGSDPTGRHQLRWWDGTRWSAHVSDAGQQSTDPLG